jgi:PAS domain-containing protein
MLNNARHRHVAAADLVRNFAHWREIGSREAVFITHHGRETHVFMGTNILESMGDPGTEVTASPNRLFELADHVHQAILLCDGEFIIRYANPAILTLSNRAQRPIDEMPLWDALPELGGTLIEAHIRHTLMTGEAGSADIPSPFRPECWINIQTQAIDGGVALLARDITSHVRQHRLADVKSAILKAMAVHGAVGYVRISARGFIEAADDTFCAMVNLPEARLTNIALADLVELGGRPEFRAELEAVLRGQGDRRTQARLLANNGRLVPLEIAIAALQGTYGTEGAVLLLTPLVEDNPAPTIS